MVSVVQREERLKKKKITSNKFGNLVNNYYLCKILINKQKNTIL